MRLRGVGIDLAVWAGLAVVFVLLIQVVFWLNRPPTPAEMQARREQTQFNTCMGWNATRALHADMQDDVCRCLVSRADIFGGTNDGDFRACRQRVAARMTSHADIGRTFDANFPQLCGKLEGGFSGQVTDGQTSFCRCLAHEVAGDAVARASYAFGVGEPAGEERDKRVFACGTHLAFGEGWFQTGPDRAAMRLPPFLPWGNLVLRCEDDAMVFEVEEAGRPVPEALEFYEDDDSRFGLPSSNGRILAPASYGLAERLVRRDNVLLEVGANAYRVSLSGFRTAAAQVLAACPEVSAPPTMVVATSTMPDPWSEIDAGYVVVRETEGLNWWGTLVCRSSPTYLTLQGPVVEAAMERHPDPSGRYLSSDVPITVAGDAGTLVEDRVFCDWGANEGDSQSCFVMLDRERLDRLFGSGTLAVNIDGEPLEPVAFAGSPVVQSASAACYRNARALP